MNFRAVVFDLDGTLLNTIDDLGDSMNTVLKSLGYPALTIADYKVIVGKGLRNLVTMSLPAEYRDKNTVDLCFERMFNEYGKRWGEKTLPYPGISELLDGLTAKGIKLAVLSNKAHNITVQIAEKFLMQWKFEAIFGERPGKPRKPDPASALEIINILDIPAAEIIYLGDSGSDMETALAAGMFPIGALWGFRDESELTAHGAKSIIQSPVELLEFFR